MTILHAIILGIVEGVTEFLPVSSTGHLILVQEFFSLSGGRDEASFTIIIQLAAILAVVAVYWRKLITDIAYVRLIAIAFIPTVVVGFFIHPYLGSLLSNIWIVVASLGIGGVALIFAEKYLAQKNEHVSLSARIALGIGIVQTLAFVPGVSRSAATILGGMFLNVSRKDATEFSFLLAIPVMVSATALEIYKNPEVFSGGSLAPLIVGFITSFVVAYIVIRWLIRFVEGHNFIGFGIYRIVLACGIIVAYLLS